MGGGRQLGENMTEKERQDDARLQEMIAEARQTYKTMLKTTQPDDITPELYLYSELAEWGQYREMLGLIETMRKKQPGNKEIDSLIDWMYDQNKAKKNKE